MIFVSLLALPAFAGDNLSRPWHATIGLYQPNLHVDGLSVRTGATLSLGYDWATSKELRIGLETRGSAYTVTSGPMTAEISLSSFLVNFTATSESSRAFGGGFIGSGSGRLTIDGYSYEGSSELIYGAFVGSNVSSTTYLQLRYQSSSAEAFRGLSLEFGYRF
jgi:hypothetical protein